MVVLDDIQVTTKVIRVYHLGTVDSCIELNPADISD